MAQELIFTRISELPPTTTIADDDVLVVNHLGKTSKITFANLMTIINEQVVHDLSDVLKRLTQLETTTSTLATTVSDQSETIDNIITAGFNLIGID